MDVDHGNDKGEGGEAQKGCGDEGACVVSAGEQAANAGAQEEACIKEGAEDPVGFASLFGWDGISDERTGRRENGSSRYAFEEAQDDEDDRVGNRQVD